MRVGGSTRGIFVNTESTPNPHSMKFLPDGNIVLPEENGTGMYFQRTDRLTLSRSPLALELFKIEGIKNVFLGRDFITVTKAMEEAWPSLKPQIFAVITEIMSSDKVCLKYLENVFF